MINVIASIRVKPGKRLEFLEIFSSNAVHVREEKGCIEYFPAVDIDANLPTQSLDENIITIIEKWADLEALHAHRSTPQMLIYKAKVKGMVEHVDMKILTDASRWDQSVSIDQCPCGNSDGHEVRF